MLHPSYNELIDIANHDTTIDQPIVKSRYSIVLATARRALQIVEQSQKEQDLEGDSKIVKPLSVAVKEFFEGDVRILNEEETKEVLLNEEKELLALEEKQMNAEREATKDDLVADEDDEEDIVDEEDTLDEIEDDEIIDDMDDTIDINDQELDFERLREQADRLIGKTEE